MEFANNWFLAEIVFSKLWVVSEIKLAIVKCVTTTVDKFTNNCIVTIVQQHLILCLLYFEHINVLMSGCYTVKCVFSVSGCSKHVAMSLMSSS